MAKSRGRKFAEITSPASGVFDLTSVPTITNAKLQNSAMTLAGSSVSLGGTGVADTDALSEGSSNVYFTDARVQTFLGGGTLAGNIVVPDNISIYLGSSSDFRLVHNTTNTQLINATGVLQITSNGGFAVTGAATFSGDLTVDTSTLKVDSSNNRVGIGTTSPSALLEVSGSAPTLILDASTQATNKKKIRLAASQFTAGDFNIQQMNDDGTTIAKTAMTIANGGNVGIGNTSPNRQLSLKHASQAEIGFKTGSVSNGALIYYNDTENKLLLRAQETSDHIEFQTGGITERMRIDSSGNVGIGTGANVDELLHIEKSSGTTIVKTEVASNSTIGFEIKKTGSTTSNWRIVDGQTVNGDLEIYDVTDSRLITSFNGAGNVKFTGSLGVNKAINAAVGLSVGADSTATNSYGLEVCNASANTRFLVDGVGNSYFYRSDNARGLTFEATSGNVGIGTARGGISPSATLHVAGENNGYDGTIRVGERGYFAHRDSGQTKTWAANNYNSDSATFGIRMKGIADSDEKLTVLGSGNVGIGETSPLGKLHVKEGDSGQGSVNSNFDQLVLEDDAHSGMTILSGTSSDGGIYFGDSGGNNMGQFKYQHGSNRFAFITNNGATNLVIQNDGHIRVNPGAADYDSHSNVDQHLFSVQTDYNANGDQNLNVVNHNGNWLDGTTGSDSAYGLMWGYGNSIRAGIHYDHRSTEKFDFYSSYAPIRFRLRNAQGNTSPIGSESTMPVKMELYEYGIGIDKPASVRSDTTFSAATAHATKRWGFGAGRSASSAPFYTINESNAGVYIPYGNQAWSAHSDERIKENITSVGTVLPSLMNMQCVKYNLKTDPGNTKIGFIAQDWESNFPEVVDEQSDMVLESDGSIGMAHSSESTTPVKGMAYTETIPLLLKAIQEQQALIEALQTEVAALKG